jgi:protein arginine kinase
MKPNNNSSILFEKKPWSNNDNTAWLGSTVSLHRNIEKFKFPAKLPTDRKNQLLSLVTKDLLSQDLAAVGGLNQPTFIKAEDIGVLEKEFLAEHFLTTENFNQTNVGEGFIVDLSGEFLATLNMRNHLRLQLTECKGELENSWSRLVAIETNLGKTLSYSFLPKFGFLTSDPTECGTGLLVSVYLQLSGLIHLEKIDEMLEKYADDSLSITGIQGNPNEVIGDIVVVQNNYTLGLTEENILSGIRSFTTKILSEENSARSQIKREQSSEFKDKISRAYGILIHSYQIEAVEALNALSLIKLGIEAGWISGISNKELNALFFGCRRAHLLYDSKEKIAQEEIPHKRAEIIHKALKDVKLLI